MPTPDGIQPALGAAEQDASWWAERFLKGVHCSSATNGDVRFVRSVNGFGKPKPGCRPFSLHDLVKEAYLAGLEARNA